MSEHPQLPYPNLPSDRRGRIRYLARVIRVEPGLLRAVDSDTAARALVGVVLFHHVNKPRQRTILKLIRSLPGPVRMKLDMRISDTLVNRSWGVWSLSTEELKQRENALEWLNWCGAALGVTYWWPFAIGNREEPIGPKEHRAQAGERPLYSYRGVVARNK